MIILDRRQYYLFLFLATLLLLGLGAASYGVIHSLYTQIMAPEGPPALEGIQSAAEVLFFLSLCGVLLLIITALSLRVRALMNFKHLDTLFAAGRSDITQPQLWKKRLGPLGEKFYAYHREILDVSHQKGLKINGLSALVRIILHNFPDSLLITDIRGTILYASPSSLETLEKTSAEILQTPITRHIPEIRPLYVASELNRSRNALSIQAGEKTLSALPAFDEREQCAYMIFALDGKKFESPFTLHRQGNREEEVRKLPKNNALRGFWSRLPFGGSRD